VISENKQTRVIWRISDGKTGHDSQSKGLVKALNQIQPCDCHDIELSNNKNVIMDFLFRHFPLGKEFSDPDIIIGAGHDTHFPLLCAKRAHGGKTIVVMKPSIPTSYFDFCFIPEHDSPKTANNILATKGAINCISTSTEQMNNRGLILIGGPSRHFYWDTEYLLQQINEIIETHRDIKWEISDSARTPEETSRALAKLREANVEYKDHSSAGAAWLGRRLNLAANVWVSADSVSMIYESLTSGAAVGLLDVPTQSTSKLTDNIAGLVENNMATPYNEWLTKRKLNKPSVQLNEAIRCAEYIYSSGLLH
jgi:mitochondrial fission protein ELM1